MKYPSGIIKNSNLNREINYKNRGLTLEADINISNEYYRNINKAFIYKKPTPIKIVKVDYKKNMISEAFFESPSTTDYNGLYNGYYIDFEAKETKNKTSFPLKNIHIHQIKHIENVYKNKGIAFLIIKFTSLDITYLLMAKEFLNFIKENDSKSIPIQYFKDKAYKIENSYMPRINYLKIIDKILEVSSIGNK